MEILKLEHASITYDGEHSAVKDISFSVEEGQIIGIVGESGSGKSTLLHSLVGLLPRSAGCRGTFSLFGRDIRTMSNNELMQMRGRDVAMIFQDTGRYMNPIARVGSQYTEFLQVHGIKSKQECLAMERDLLSRVHLHDADRVLRSYPFELSGGMRQRVGIAMAMTLKPKLLLADEPTSALDVTVQAQVVYEMMELRRKYGTTIVIVTHNIGVAAYMSDVLGVMQRGRMVEWGRTEDVISNPREEYTRSLLSSIVELNDERLTG